ncbi:MAG: hypothetical protein AAF366_03325 [Pseudomonadota bacterium]
MSDHIYYIQAATDSANVRGYEPQPPEGVDAEDFYKARMTHQYNVRFKGEDPDPIRFPSELVFSRTNPASSLDVPIFQNLGFYVRREIAETLGHFDIGRSLLKPVTVHLSDGSTNEDYVCLFVADWRSTIDPERSEPFSRTYKNRPKLRTSKAIHTGVFASPEALVGPALWFDPDVSNTFFVNADLGKALKAGHDGKKLKLKKIMISGEAN